MKKILLSVVLVAVIATVVFLTAGCTNSVTPSTAWADEETLNYDIQKSATTEKVGEMTVKTVRSPANKTLNEKEYSSADGKVTIDITMTGKYTIHTEFLTARYTVLAIRKEYTDLADASKSYVFSATHSGDYYYYDKNGAKGEIKVGSSYTDSEYLYHYIRCYPLSSPPSGFKIADPEAGVAKKITTSVYGTTTMTVPYPSGAKEVNCTVIAIGLTDKPQGSPIYVAYTPDSSEYNMKLLSKLPSKKMPVKIIENDLTYVVTSMSAN